MKTIVPLLDSVVATTSTRVTAVRASSADSYIPLLKSISAGTLHLARKLCSKKCLDIARRFQEVIAEESLFAALLGHLKVVRIINRSNGRGLATRDANYVNKYIKEYLARSFNKTSRREILLFHHTYLTKKVHASFYDEILRSEPVLWRHGIGNDQYAISISFNAQWHSEGDLSLTFSRNHLPLYEASFTIVPGDLIGCESPSVLLVGRIQGARGRLDEIRASTKACHDIAPAYLLLAATESIASALVIDVVAGVSSSEQLAITRSDVEGGYFDYDAFWTTLLSKRNAHGFYELPIPFLEKPLEAIKTSHRRRVRRKRREKQQVGQTIAANFKRAFVSNSNT